MAWVKDAVSDAPRTIYTAPEEALPLVKVVYDPNAAQKWILHYAFLNTEEDTQESIESAMEF